ncbi:MAG TPA: tetratricopeptide repeat protein, partial [Verrucomicrobiota bacterium]|nr:tetratricopeptide repeat protein [Verrucomicrobiota bacterium]
MDVYLSQLYHDHSDLLVPFYCADYERKDWCRLEWRQMRDIIKRRQDESIMPFRFDDAPIAGVLSIDGYVKIDQRTANDVVALILERLAALDFGRSYANPLAGVKAAPVIDTSAVAPSTGSTPGPTASAAPLVSPQLSTLLALLGQSQSASQVCRPKPRFQDLFEIVSDPDEVARALYGADPGTSLAPYEVAYLVQRDGKTETRAILDKALARARGRLVICGHAGTGKTREAAEYARYLCARNWKIGVARSDSDAQLGEISTIPPELRGTNLLLVIDDLHTRVVAREDGQPPYLDRLEACLGSLEKFFGENASVIAVARSEPHFRQLLQLAPGQSLWRSFAVCQLPDFSLESLQQLLGNLASQVHVEFDPQQIRSLIENSDRRPETLFSNVRLAQHDHVPLGERWSPRDGLSWQTIFLRAQAKYPVTDEIYHALRLLGEAGLPRRVAYVAAISQTLAEEDTAKSIEGLVEDGFLRLRQGVLSAYSDQQLAEGLQETEVPPICLEDQWGLVIRTIHESPASPEERSADLVSLAFALIGAKQTARAGEVTGLAVECDPTNARAFFARAGALFLSGRFAGSEHYLTESLTRDPSDSNARFLRGVARNLLGDFAGMITDLDAAIAQGRNDSMVYTLRALAHSNLGNLPKAQEDYTAAIERGQNDAIVFLARGGIRHQLRDYAGAESDFSAALERGIDFETAMRPAAALSRGDVTNSLDLLTQAKAGRTAESDAMLRGLRGTVRLAQGKFPEAEEDLSFALEHGGSRSLSRVSELLRDAQLPGFAHAKEQLASAQGFLAGNGAYYQLRGIARRELNRLSEADEDFSAALAAGLDHEEVYFARGLNRLRWGRPGEAETDFDNAIQRGRNEADVFYLRGVSLLSQQKLLLAEADFDAAIQRGKSDGQTLFFRAAARLDLGKVKEAEADADAALNQGHRDAATYFIRGAARVAQEKHVLGEEDLDTAVANGRCDGATYYLRGIARYHQQKLDLAEADLSLAIDNGKADLQTYSWRAGVRIDRGNFAGAEQDLDAAIAGGRTDSMAFFGRGVARLSQQKFAAAVEDFTHAIQTGKVDAEAFRLRAEASGGRDEYVAADEDYTAAIAAGADNPRIYLRRAMARQAMGDKAAEAEADLSVAIDRGLDQPEVYFERAQLRCRLGRFEEGANDIEASIARGRDDAATHVLLAAARTELKQYADAERGLDAVIARAPQEFLARSLRGRLRLIRADLEAAQADLDVAVEQRPDDGESRYLRGSLRYIRGNLRGALDDYDAAAANGRDDSTVHCNRACAYFRLCLFSEGEGACNQALRCGAEHPDSVGCLGVKSLAQGDFGTAVGKFDEGVAASQGTDWQFWRGLANLLLGKLAEAESAYLQGLANSLPADLALAIEELNYWSERWSDVVGRVGAADTLARIKASLRAALGTATTPDSRALSGAPAAS